MVLTTARSNLPRGRAGGRVRGQDDGSGRGAARGRSDAPAGDKRVRGCDCTEAIAYADGVLAAVRARHGDDAAREIVTTLARPVVIAPDGARAWVDLDASGELVVSAAAITDDARDAALTGMLVNKRVRGTGRWRGSRTGLARRGWWGTVLRVVDGRVMRVPGV